MIYCCQVGCQWPSEYIYLRSLFVKYTMPGHVESVSVCGNVLITSYDLENTLAIVSFNASSITKSLNDFHLNCILHPYLHLSIYPKSLDY